MFDEFHSEPREQSASFAVLAHGRQSLGQRPPHILQLPQSAQFERVMKPHTVGPADILPPEF